MIRIALLYVGVLTLMYIALSVRTLRTRRRLGIAVGDAGNETMLRAIRVHANFAEYVPLALIVLCLVERSGGGAPWTHALGVCLLVGRLAHAWGVRQPREDFRFRVVGMALTLGMLGVGALRLLYVFVLSGML